MTTMEWEAMWTGVALLALGAMLLGLALVRIR